MPARGRALQGERIYGLIGRLINDDRDTARQSRANVEDSIRHAQEYYIIFTREYLDAAVYEDIFKGKCWEGYIVDIALLNTYRQN